MRWRDKAFVNHGLPAAWVFITGICLSSCGRETGGPAARVILISCDTLRADRLGVYGYERGISPNLDRLAEDCVVFDAAYSAAPSTSPSMSTLLTGRHPDELGVRGNKVQMPPDVATLAEALQQEGIETAAVVSNWVLSRENSAAGAGVSQGFGHFDDRMTTTEINRLDLPERTASETTEAALEWLSKRKSDRFFLWVHYQDPHGPYTPPLEDIEALDRPLGDEDPLPRGKRQSGFGKLPAYQLLEEECRPEFYRIRYDAEIRYFDRELGRLLDGLEGQGLMKDALIVFTADHGESLGEHNHWFAHGQHLYRDVVRVPFLVRYPERAQRPTGIKDGRFLRVGDLIGHTDVCTTVLDAFGLKPLPGYGASLLIDRIASDRVMAHMGAGWFGITDSRFRAHWSENRVYLFDVLEDPGETQNLASSQPEKVQELMQRYKELRASIPPLAAEGIPSKTSKKNLQALDALGYGGGEDD
jgi:arylsulfatase